MEFIGFILSILALIYITYKQHAGVKKGEVKGQEEEAMEEELMKMLHIPVSSAPSPPKVPKRPKQLSLEKRQLKSPLEERTLTSRLHHEEDKLVRNPPRVAAAVGRLANRRDLLIYKEVIDRPVGMR